MSSDEDETILELCKKLKIKIPPKKPKSLTHNSIHPISNLENLDLNNLPILILEEVIETTMIQEPEEMLEKQTRVVSLEEMSYENVPDLTTVTDGLIDNEQNLIQDVDNVEVNENEKSTNNEYFGDLNSKRKRKSKGQVKSDNKREWTRNKCKKLRLEGESYMGYRRDSKQEKFKVLHDVMRPAREIGPRCFSEFCKKSKLRGCNNIAETERQEIFIIFWKQMDWSQRQQINVYNTNEQTEWDYFLVDEVRSAARKLRNEKAAGPDGICSEIIKYADDSMLQFILLTFNNIAKSEIIPKQWLLSNITLIHKKGNKHNIDNYRPISIFSIMYKLFMTMIRERLHKTLDEQQPPAQAGFRPQFSTIDHLHTITN
ncbi:unnamed protein product [Leptosia nina]|uniref:Reverse transcriptase domain-containing protein n=1 Tax=Leptosia nina TaxID=320188 RepID=A0AAV1JWM3_9NEOP